MWTTMFPLLLQGCLRGFGREFLAFLAAGILICWFARLTGRRCLRLALVRGL